MKNVNVMGDSMKNLIFRGGSQKPIYKGEMPEKREGGLDSLQIEGGAWKRRWRWCFRGGLIPQCTLC